MVRDYLPDSPAWAQAKSDQDVGFFGAVVLSGLIAGAPTGSIAAATTAEAAQAGSEAASAAQGALLRARLAAEEAAGARLPDAITGYTRHGLNQAISRDGVGVSVRAILDAFRSPLSIAGQSGGRFMMIGRDAVVVINADGQIVTTWATSSAGIRVVE